MRAADGRAGGRSHGQYTAHAHRCLKRNVGNGLPQGVERVDGDGFAALVGQEGEPLFEVGKLAGVAFRHDQGMVRARQQQHGVHPGSLAHEALGDCGDLLSRRCPGQVPRKLVERARFALPAERNVRLPAEPRRQLRGDERHGEHDAERDDVLHVADRERKARRHEQEVEQQDRETAASTAGPRPARTPPAAPSAGRA